MEKNNQIIILGSGTSTGVPIVGCPCKVCHSSNIKNKRLRTSILIKTKNKKNILIDTGPDLRTQLLNNAITRIDAAIITHDHADHTHGIDDLRPFFYWQKKSIPLFLNKETIKSLTEKFSYIFDYKTLYQGRPIIGGGVPKLTLNEVKLNTENTILENDFYLTELPHGYIKSLSFTHSKLAYIVDCHDIPDSYLERLKNLKLEILIIDCIKEEKHDTHLYLEKTLSFIEKIKPQFAGLIHLGHELEHERLTLELKSRGLDYIQPLFDGQILNYQ